MSTEEQKTLTEFGRKLKRMRETKRISYRKFSVVAGISVSYILKLESGISDPSFTTLLKLSRALEVDLNEFVARKN